MRHTRWRAIAAFSCQVATGFVGSAWLASVLAGRGPRWYISSSAEGWDNLFLLFLMPALTALLVRAPLQPTLSPAQVKSAWLVCGIYALACAFFGARGLGILLAVDAVLHLFAWRVRD